MRGEGGVGVGVHIAGRQASGHSLSDGFEDFGEAPDRHGAFGGWARPSRVPEDAGKEHIERLREGRSNHLLRGHRGSTSSTASFFAVRVFQISSDQIRSDQASFCGAFVPY